MIHLQIHHAIYYFISKNTDEINIHINYFTNGVYIMLVYYINHVVILRVQPYSLIKILLNKH